MDRDRYIRIAHALSRAYGTKPHSYAVRALLYRIAKGRHQ